MSDIPRRLLLPACLALLFAAPFAPPPARAAPWPAQPPLRLYEARALVTGTDLRSRPAGLAQCLRDVLVQVSGNPALAADPRVPGLAPRVEDLLADFDYVDRMGGIPTHDEQGSSDRPYWLTARFDRARLDALLTQLGERPWPEPRPTLVPDVTVIGPNGTAPLTAATPEAADRREALAAAAERYAVPLSLPGAGAPPPPPATIRLRGTLAWSDAAHGWIGLFRDPRGNLTWGASGVSYDEAFRVMVRGAAAIASGHEKALAWAGASTP